MVVEPKLVEALDACGGFAEYSAAGGGKVGVVLIDDENLQTCLRR